MAVIDQEFTPNWDEYSQQAQQYIDRPAFNGTAMTGQLLAEGAKDAYVNTGQYIPVELALAQAQKESSMGTKGKSPKMNPYNVFEFDSGTKRKFKTPQEGVNYYFNLLAKDYMPNKGMEQLMQNFVNEKGLRYASDPDYESYFQSQVPYIQKFIERNK